jgi:hypothetical protein
VLMQLGVIGKAEPQPAASATPDAVHSVGRSIAAGGSGSQVLGSDSPVTSNPTSWNEIRARWTPRSGPQRTTQASTVRYCISTGEGIRLDDTEDIPFQRMKKLTIVGTPPAALTPGGRANLRIDLVTGRSLTGTMGVDCDFIGYDDVGRFSYYPDRLRSIEFLWGQ